MLSRNKQQYPATVPWNPQKPTIAIPQIPGQLSLPQIPIWQPTVPPIGTVEGPNEGSGEGPAQPTAQPTAQPGTVPISVPGSPDGLMARLKDPRLAGWLMAVGAAMGQPRAVGQTGWGQASQALAQGYNYLAMQKQLQEARQRQAWEDQLRINAEARANSTTQAQINATNANIAQGSRSLDLRQEAQNAEILDRKEERKLRKEYQDNTYNLGLNELILKKDQIDNEVAQAEARLQEMSTERKDTKEYREAQLELERKRLQQEVLFNAAKIRATNAEAGHLDASALEAQARAQAIKDGTYGRGGTAGYNDPAMMDAYHYASAENNIRAQVEKERMMNGQSQEWAEAEVQKRIAPIKAAYESAINVRDQRVSKTPTSQSTSSAQTQDTSKLPTIPTAKGGDNTTDKVPASPPPAIIRQLKPMQTVTGPDGSVWQKQADGNMKMIRSPQK